MNIKITGKELKATEAIKEYVEKKCERLQKYTEEEIDVKVTIKTEGKNQVAELSANINGNIYRAVTEKSDLYASIDKDIDIIEGQIRKTKAKKEKQINSGSIKEQEIISFNVESHKVENEVLKTNRNNISYSEVPMEACYNMSKEDEENFIKLVDKDIEVCIKLYNTL